MSQQTTRVGECCQKHLSSPGIWLWIIFWSLCVQNLFTVAEHLVTFHVQFPGSVWLYKSQFAKLRLGHSTLSNTKKMSDFVGWNNITEGIMQEALTACWRVNVSPSFSSTLVDYKNKNSSDPKHCISIPTLLPSCGNPGGHAYNAAKT